LCIFADKNSVIMPETKVHEGRNIKRIREILGIKQEALAADLEMSQQNVSLLEQKETVDPALLNAVAKVLKVSPEAIRNFSEEAAVNFFNTFNDNSVGHVIGNYGTYNFNPVERWIELLEENKNLYERLLESEREKVELMKKQQGL
jgi:transcriptional regulator with XRE-family HTH domain